MTGCDHTLTVKYTVTVTIPSKVWLIGVLSVLNGKVFWAPWEINGVHYKSFSNSQKRTRLYRGEHMLENSRKSSPIGTEIGPLSRLLMPFTVGILFFYHGNNLLTV